MVDDAKHSKWPKTARRFWPWFGLAVVVAVMFLPPLLTRHTICKGPSLVDLEMSLVQSALLDYKAAFGAFPSGDGPAVFRALRGENPQKLVFLACRAVSADGGALDPWGTPYKLYFSGEDVLVRSAGPNKRFDSSADKGFDDRIR